MKPCVLDPQKECDDCHACDDRCQLDPTKVCDNCFRCLDAPNGEEKAYAEVPIAGVYMEESDYLPEWALLDQEYDPNATYRKTNAVTLPGMCGKRPVTDKKRRILRYPRRGA